MSQPAKGASSTKTDDLSKPDEAKKTSTPKKLKTVYLTCKKCLRLFCVQRPLKSSRATLPKLCTQCSRTSSSPPSGTWSSLPSAQSLNDDTPSTSSITTSTTTTTKSSSTTTLYYPDVLGTQSTARPRPLRTTHQGIQRVQQTAPTLLLCTPLDMQGVTWTVNPMGSTQTQTQSTVLTVNPTCTPQTQSTVLTVNPQSICTPLDIQGPQQTSHPQSICTPQTQSTVLTVNPTCTPQTQSTVLTVNPLCSSQTQGTVLTVNPLCSSQTQGTVLTVNPLCTSQTQSTVLTVNPLCSAPTQGTLLNPQSISPPLGIQGPQQTAHPEPVYSTLGIRSAQLTAGLLTAGLQGTRVSEDSVSGENINCHHCVKGFMEEYELLNHLAMFHRYEGSSGSESD